MHGHAHSITTPRTCLSCPAEHSQTCGDALAGSSAPRPARETDSQQWSETAHLCVQHTAPLRAAHGARVCGGSAPQTRAPAPQRASRPPSGGAAPRRASVPRLWRRAGLQVPRLSSPLPPPARWRRARSTTALALARCACCGRSARPARGRGGTTGSSCCPSRRAPSGAQRTAAAGARAPRRRDAPAALAWGAGSACRSHAPGRTELVGSAATRSGARPLAEREGPSEAVAPVAARFVPSASSRF